MDEDRWAWVASDQAVMGQAMRQSSVGARTSAARCLALGLPLCAVGVVFAPTLIVGVPLVLAGLVMTPKALIRRRDAALMARR